MNKIYGFIWKSYIKIGPKLKKFVSGKTCTCSEVGMGMVCQYCMNNLLGKVNENEPYS